MTVMRFLERRQREKDALVQARRERMLSVLPTLVSALVARGARRVWLFGSLVWGGVHQRSDTDLAVEGLSAEEFRGAPKASSCSRHHPTSISFASRRRRPRSPTAFGPPGACFMVEPRRAALAVLILEIRADRDAVDRHAGTGREALRAFPGPRAHRLSPWSPSPCTISTARRRPSSSGSRARSRVCPTTRTVGIRICSTGWCSRLTTYGRPYSVARPRARWLRCSAFAISFATLTPWRSSRRLQLAAEDVLRAHALLGDDLDAFERTLTAAHA